MTDCQGQNRVDIGYRVSLSLFYMVVIYEVEEQG